MTWRAAWLLPAAVAAVALPGCTHQSAHPAPTIEVTVTQTHTLPPTPGGPLSTGPTTAAAANSCPLIGKQAAADAVGMRLARIQTLTSGGRLVGCRFYALQNSPLHTSEHLPGPNQPAAEITSARYSDATSAHNALARLAGAGGNPQQFTVAAGVVGVAFQTRFDPHDGNRDWACGFSTDSTLVVVKTANAKNSFNAKSVAQAIAGKF